jgi:hypothetical protein
VRLSPIMLLLVSTWNQKSGVLSTMRISGNCAQNWGLGEFERSPLGDGRGEHRGCLAPTNPMVTRWPTKSTWRYFSSRQLPAASPQNAKWSRAQTVETNRAVVSEAFCASGVANVQTIVEGVRSVLGQMRSVDFPSAKMPHVLLPGLSQIKEFDAF